MADGHHKSYLVFLGCGEEKEPAEVRITDLEPPARTEKYRSSDNMDEAGIPMLASEYNIVI